MTSCCNKWTSKGSTGWSITTAFMSVYCLLLWKSNIRQLKMYIKKDNINTIHQNDTFSGSWHLSFTQFQLYKPNQIKVLNTALKGSLLTEWSSDRFVYFPYEYTTWFKYDRDWFVFKQAASVPVIFEPTCHFTVKSTYSVDAIWMKNEGENYTMPLKCCSKLRKKINTKLYRMWLILILKKFPFTPAGLDKNFNTLI